MALAMPGFWLENSPTEPQSRLDCPAASAAASSPLSQPSMGLGSRWEVNEGCWRGVYVRRGNSNVFDAEWTLLDGRRFTAEVTLNVQGNQVTGQRRRATLGGDCNLAFGTLGPDGVTVTGRWDCTHPEGAASGCFFARIDGGGAPVNPPSTDFRSFLLNNTFEWIDNGTKIGTITFFRDGSTKPTWINIPHTWSIDSNGDLMVYGGGKRFVIRLRFDPATNTFSGARDRTSQTQDGVSTFMRPVRR